MGVRPPNPAISNLAGPEQRREVRTYLAAMAKADDPAFRQKMADKLNDPDPNRWIPFEEAEKRLGL